jgi:hypothetical protein
MNSHLSGGGTWSHRLAAAGACVTLFAACGDPAATRRAPGTTPPTATEASASTAAPAATIEQPATSSAAKLPSVWDNPQVLVGVTYTDNLPVSSFVKQLPIAQDDVLCCFQGSIGDDGGAFGGVFALSKPSRDGSIIVAFERFTGKEREHTITDVVRLQVAPGQTVSWEEEACRVGKEPDYSIIAVIEAEPVNDYHQAVAAWRYTRQGLEEVDPGQVTCLTLLADEYQPSPPSTG